MKNSLTVLGPSLGYYSSFVEKNCLLDLGEPKYLFLIEKKMGIQLTFFGEFQPPNYSAVVTKAGRSSLVLYFRHFDF